MSYYQTFQMKSPVFQLFAVGLMVIITMCLMLPAIQNGHKMSSFKGPVQKSLHQTLAAHRHPVTLRAASL